MNKYLEENQKHPILQFLAKAPIKLNASPINSNLLYHYLKGRKPFWGSENTHRLALWLAKYGLKAGEWEFGVKEARTQHLYAQRVTYEISSTYMYRREYFCNAEELNDFFAHLPAGDNTEG